MFSNAERAGQAPAAVSTVLKCSASSIVSKFTNCFMWKWIELMGGIGGGDANKNKIVGCTSANLTTACTSPDASTVFEL